VPPGSWVISLSLGYLLLNFLLYPEIDKRV
jgi:hypothetical protein